MQIHIGKEIEKVYQHSGMKLSEFAKRINTSARNVYSIFARKEIKTDQLIKISQVLHFDFFTLYRMDKDAVSRLEEPQEIYSDKANKVTVIIELDGQPASLEQGIKKLRAINQAIGPAQ
jgi:Cro/C1-type HTH DNA-binding domain